MDRYMETVLNTIIDNARAAVAQGQPKLNVYPVGTLRHLAYELGASPTNEAIVATREDGQVFGVMGLDEGEYQSIVPQDLAEQGLGKCHSTLEDAAEYLNELVTAHGLGGVSKAA